MTLGRFHSYTGRKELMFKRSVTLQKFVQCVKWFFSLNTRACAQALRDAGLFDKPVVTT
ncbi:MAG: hypothetical protein H6937_05130 [Burkholderiales bacterium]|nr:hypothetical protein [Burkholderiales bacterium]